MVQLHYYNTVLNIGDQLAPVITNWVLSKLSIQDKSTENINLLTVGSVLAADFFYQDAVVWGTGIHYIEDAGRLGYDSKRRKLDVRAVRGPITRRALEQAGYSCPHIYGDPAILMPLIYPKRKSKDRGKISVIRQLHQTERKVPGYINAINVKTKKYEEFIDELISSEKVISSSLHGLILGESYGIPSVFLLEEETQEIIKYFDWYYSTGRSHIKIAHSIEEAIRITPMELPDITTMQEQLLKSFPQDIYQPDYSYQKKKEIVLFGMGNCFERYVDSLKNKVKIKYICDNDSSKWGTTHNGLICISPEQLKSMKDIYVVITIYNKKYLDAIQEQLDKWNIVFYETVFQWLRHTHYDCFM